MAETSSPVTGKVTRPVPSPQAPAVEANVVLVGGYRMLRLGLKNLLGEHGVHVAGSYVDADEFTASQNGDHSGDEVIIQLLPGDEPFATFRRMEHALGQLPSTRPLVVVAERIARGEVYSALRIGAKAYVSLDAEPAELVKAIRMALEDKVHLSPEAAELLVSDVSGAVDPNRPGRLPSVNLSKREIEIVQLMCEGHSSKQIGRTLHISPKTVENHRYNIYRKCGIESVASLVRYAIQNGLVTV